MRKKRFPIVQCALFVIICLSVYVGVGESDRSNKEEGQKQLEEQLQKAIVQCYSIEGEYPPSLTYLKENYHIYIDEKSYQVDYLYEGGNMKPTLLIMRKENNYEE